MKSKVFLFLMFLSMMGFAQSVPNTTTFNLQNVVTAVSPTTNDLTDCFSDANSDYWNYYYKDQYYSDYGNINNLLMFRNYNITNANYDCIASAAGSSTSGDNKIWLQPPPSVANGNLLILIMASNDGGLTFNTPTGWNLLYATYATGNSYGIYTRTANNETAAYVYASRIPVTGLFAAEIFRFTAFSSFGTNSGAMANSVSSRTFNDNVTTTGAVRFVTVFYDSAPAITPTISKDYHMDVGINFGNRIYIYGSCAKTGLQKYLWEGSTCVALHEEYFPAN